MMKASTIVFLALFCIVAVGCGRAMEEQKAAASAPTANVAGTWTGTAGTGGTTVPVSLTLAQNGTAVSGNLSVAGRPDLSGPVKGTVQGELVNLSLATVTFAQMRAQQNTMTGQGSVGPVNLRRSQ